MTLPSLQAFSEAFLMPPMTHIHLIQSAYVFAAMLTPGTHPGPSVPVHTFIHLPVNSACLGTGAWAWLEMYVHQLKSL